MSRTAELSSRIKAREALKQERRKKAEAKARETTLLFRQERVILSSVVWLQGAADLPERVGRLLTPLLHQDVPAKDRRVILREVITLVEDMDYALAQQARNERNRSTK